MGRAWSSDPAVIVLALGMLTCACASSPSTTATWFEDDIEVEVPPFEALVWVDGGEPIDALAPNALGAFVYAPDLRTQSDALVGELLRRSAVGHVDATVIMVLDMPVGAARAYLDDHPALEALPVRYAVLDGSWQHDDDWRVAVVDGRGEVRHAMPALVLPWFHFGLELLGQGVSGDALTPRFVRSTMEPNDRAAYARYAGDSAGFVQHSEALVDLGLARLRAASVRAHLALGQTVAAYLLIDRLAIEHPAPRVLRVLAAAILDAPDPLDRDLDLALELAERAHQLTGEQDPDVMYVLARVHAARGEEARATALQQALIELLDSRPHFISDERARRPIP